MHLLPFAGLLAQATTQPPDAAGEIINNATTTGSYFGPAEFAAYLMYFVAALLFVFGLKMLSSPRTARRGNTLASLGMFVAIVVALIEVFSNEDGGGAGGIVVIVLGFIIGGGVGLWAARTVPMTGMPEMVALFNGSGGVASALVAFGEYFRPLQTGEVLRGDIALTIGLSVLIGMVTLTGSVVAFLKLAGKTVAGVRMGNPLQFPGHRPLATLLGLAVIALIGVVTASGADALWAVILILVIASVLGVLLTIPIGGADMPVVISLLNSYSGLAACATGFVLENAGLIVSGSLVGASGLILTQIMCKAMDRSLLNVLAGGFGEESTGVGSTQSAEGLTVRKMDGEEAAMVLEAAQQVVIVPGYGMAVAQAQHTVAEMAELLRKRDIAVKYAIHPVAGRMPGHMNVLLAEANVDYDLLYDLEINNEMPQTDVAIVIGANDVVNPGARDDPNSQIYGMPIIEVDKCKTVMVCKRSLNPGFAGIDNPLFYNQNTTMLFGDAKAMITSIVSALKEG